MMRTILAAAISLAVGAAPATAAPAEASSVVDPFYSPPAAVPATPGTVMRTQPTQHLFNILGPDFPGHATRMLYTILTEADDPVAASGTVIEPTRPWSGKGPTPTVVIAPGTRGQADSCAPSQGPLMTGNVDLPEQTVAFNYDLMSVYWATTAGMRVIVPDYIGLGTPGIHTYVHTWESARAVLDGARAGLAVAGVPGDSPVGFYGYSQGGGAAAGAAELHATYAPELNLRGTFAGAPPADLEVVMPAVDRSSIVGVLGYAVNGFAERDPEFSHAIDEVFNDQGRAFLADAAASCIIDSVLTQAFTDSRTLTTTGESFAEVSERDPRISRVLAAQRLGRAPVTGPIMISNGVHDDIIPASQATQLGRDLCGQGNTVSYLANLTPPVMPGARWGINHGAPMVGDLPASMGYLVDRFNGAPAPDTCGRF